jgi:sarcosine oxidase subunit gamma
MDDAAGVWAGERPLAAFISLRGLSSDRAFAAAVPKAMGVALPLVPCTFTAAGQTKVLWLSPDEWMIVAPRVDRDRLLAALNQSLAGIRSQVVDNSGGYAEVLLTGTSATDVLTHATVYDVRALEAGRVVGTTFGKASVFLRREGEGYVLLFRRSFADYIWRTLERAASPYGFAVATSDRAGAP